MSDLDWNQINTFLAVADTGSLVAAARSLRMTQPALGRQISMLEEKLGSSLFIRGRSGMKLTETGLALVDEARAVKNEVDRFLLKAAGHDERISGTVRITASRVVSIYILPAMLARLKQAEPAIEIELVPDNAVANLIARDADIAIRMVRPLQNDLIATKITEIPLGAYAHQSYIARRGKPETIDDLKHHDVIGYDREDRMLVAMRELGIPAERSFFSIRTDDEVAAWEMVKAGAGIGFAQQHLAADAPGIVRVVPDLPIPTLPVWLTAHQDLRTSRRIRRVMDFLTEEMKALAARI